MCFNLENKHTKEYITSCTIKWATLAARVREQLYAGKLLPGADEDVHFELGMNTLQKPQDQTQGPTARRRRLGAESDDWQDKVLDVHHTGIHGWL